MKKTIFILAATAAFLSCSKSGSDDGNGGGGTSPVLHDPVTIQTMMATSGKRWPVSEAKLTYYSTTGSVDSTITLDVTGRTMYFTNNNGVNGIYLNFDTQDPVTRIVPAFGSWSLNTTTNKITFTCISPYCNGTNGDWQITSHVIITLNPLFEGLTMERSVALAANRRVQQKIDLLIY